MRERILLRVILLITLIFNFVLIECQQPLEAVVKYRTKDFKEKVPTKHHAVLFFTQWSGETKSVAPVWEELGQKYNNLPSNEVILVKVDCSQDVELCAEQNVTDYPTIKFYKQGGSPGGIRYRGVRDFHSIEQFVVSNVNKNAEFVHGARVASPPPPYYGLFTLDDENFDDVIQNGAAFVNFCAQWSTRCMDLTPIWGELAKEFQYDEDIIFGFIDCTLHKSKCNEHEVRGYPNLVWFVDGVITDKYTSKERGFDSLKAYVYKKLGKTEQPKKNPNAEEAESRSNGLILDKDNFDSTLAAEPIIFANFHTPWCTPCQKLDPMWEDLSAKYKYVPGIKIARVDCTRNKALCEEKKIDEYPTMNVYKNGVLDKAYTGELMLEHLIKFTGELLTSSETDKNIKTEL